MEGRGEEGCDGEKAMGDGGERGEGSRGGGRILEETQAERKGPRCGGKGCR